MLELVWAKGYEACTSMRWRHTMFVDFKLYGCYIICKEIWWGFRVCWTTRPNNLVTCGLDSISPKTIYGELKTKFNQCPPMHKPHDVHYLFIIGGQPIDMCKQCMYAHAISYVSLTLAKITTFPTCLPHLCSKKCNLPTPTWFKWVGGLKKYVSLV